LDAMKLLENNNNLFNFSNRYRAKDGSYRVIEWRSYPSNNNIYAAARDITDRKAIEDSLRLSESNLEVAQKIAKVGSWSWDMINNKILWSKEMFRVFDIDQETYDGKPEILLSRIHPEDKDVFLNSMNSNIVNASSPALEYRVIHRDGSIHNIYAEGRYTFDESGKPIYSYGTAQDITERKKLEDELKLSEAFFKKGEEIGKFGYWVLDVDSDLMTVSDNAVKIIGLNINENITEQIKRMVLPEYVPIMKKAFNDAILNIAPYDIEEKLQRETDGKIIDLHSKAEYDAEKNVFYGTIQDITERKLVENAIRKQENFMRILTDNLPGMVGYWTKDLINGFANNKYMEWFGKTRQEMNGISMIELMGEDLFKLNKPNIDRVLKGERISFERTLVKADGSTGYTWAHYIPDIQNDVLEGFYVLVSDITEIKLASIELELLNNKLQQLNSTKDKFFSIIAHDLRSPLGTFKQMTEMLHDSYGSFSEEELIEFLDIMKNSSKNIFELLENLLEWSRSQRRTIKYEPLDINLFFHSDNILHLLKPVSDNKKIKIINAIKRSIFIKADHNLLNTILRNLIMNAIKFTYQDGEIIINSEQNNNEIIISVKDSGVGMTKEQIEKLFRIDSSISTQGTNLEKGTGLGLILCKEFVELHGGKIWVESEIGKGSTFYFTMPKSLNNI
jgi:PAS domain S-box-containing protein